MKQLRRLDPGGDDPYLRARSYALHYLSVDAEAFASLRRDAPALVLAEDGALLFASVGPGIANLQYGFRNTDTFVRRFPDMLGRLLPAIDREDASMGVRFRLTDTASRPNIEPTLRELAFDVSRDWVRMELPTLPRIKMHDDEIAKGYRLRPVRRSDAAAIAAIDASAFAMSWLTAEMVRGGIGDEPVFRVLQDEALGEPIGFLQLTFDGPETGHVSTVALREEYQRRGLGEAMVRWALAYFRNEGMTSAALTVNSENWGAIALYRKLGFEAGATGLDYRRPIDEDEVQQLLQSRVTTRITARRRT